MKELSIEEKAKAYDEVRKKIAIRFGSNVADEIFSEFEMSEDEKIRKALLEYFSHYGSTHCQSVQVADILTWLEKQGEQNPVEWSEEDEKMLKSLKTLLNNASCYLCPETTDKIISWLKSLRPQNTWKPSDEQMKAMQKALVDLCGKDEHNIITGLYYDLKKLREE